MVSAQSVCVAITITISITISISITRYYRYSFSGTTKEVVDCSSSTAVLAHTNAILTDVWQALEWCLSNESDGDGVYASLGMASIALRTREPHQLESATEHLERFVHDRQRSKALRSRRGNWAINASQQEKARVLPEYQPLVIIISMSITITITITITNLTPGHTVRCEERHGRL